MSYEKKSVGQLKDALKELGMVGAGDKGTLIHRLKLHDKCTQENLKTESGENPCKVKMGDLKKVVARLGISPIGTQDELLTALVEHLSAEARKNSNAGAASTGGSSSSSSAGGVDAIEVAEEVLRLDGEDDDEGVLNVLGPAAKGTSVITRNSSVATMRKNYLRISLLIHPDKIGKSFSGATRAFQALVQAFERLSTAGQVAEEDGRMASRGGRPAPAAGMISRSNEGCVRTRVCCPRCKEPWSESNMEGNPDYFYNLMMMGLKRFNCSTCLCEFGCVTAIHKCPQCKNPFEYSPVDFHRKVGCGNEGCRTNDRPFGFYMFHVSDRVMTDLKKELLEEVERRTKSREAKLRRAARCGASSSVSVKPMASSSAATAAPSASSTSAESKSAKSSKYSEEEKAFLCGLVDACPRCGQFLESYKKVNKHDKSELSPQELHLRACSDAKAHARHAAAKAKAEKKAAAKDSADHAMDSVQSLAAWQFLGGKKEDMWQLTDDALRMHAGNMGLLEDRKSGKATASSSSDKSGSVSTAPNRYDLMQKISEATSGNSKLRLGDGKPSSATSKASRGDEGTSSSLAIVLRDEDDAEADHGKGAKRRKIEGAAASGDKRAALIGSLPSNMHSCSTSQLISFCVSNGLMEAPRGGTDGYVKKDLIKLIERAVDTATGMRSESGGSAAEMLGNGAPTRKAQASGAGAATATAAAAKRRRNLAISSDSESDGSEEYSNSSDSEHD